MERAREGIKSKKKTKGLRGRNLSIFEEKKFSRNNNGRGSGVFSFIFPVGREGHTHTPSDPF
jgi:hypothetical protein